MSQQYEIFFVVHSFFWLSELRRSIKVVWKSNGVKDDTKVSKRLLSLCRTKINYINSEFRRAILNLSGVNVLYKEVIQMA